jgi:hypothetical protein
VQTRKILAQITPAYSTPFNLDEDFIVIIAWSWCGDILDADVSCGVEAGGAHGGHRILLY